MAFTQKGLIDSIGPIVKRDYNDKTFVSREVVLEQPSYDPYTGEKRTSNFIKFEATKQELCDALNNFPVGTKVEVEFIIRGSKYEKKKDGAKTGVFDTFNRIELRAIAFASASTQAQGPTGASPIPAAAPIPAPAPVAPAPTASDTPADNYDSELGF